VKYIKLPRTDLLVSRLCFGCWGIISDQHWGERNREQAIEAIRAAFDAGVNFFDTAAMYGMGESERLLGQALAGSRQQTVVATKIAPQQMHPSVVPEACEQALRALDTDYIDLLQTHWTSPDVPIAETWEAMIRLQQQGKVRFLGVCNMGLGDLADIDALSRPVTNQLPYNLLWRMIETENLPHCRSHDIGVLAYSPLMHGLLADKFDGPDEVPEGRARSRHFSSSRPLARHGEPGRETETFEALRGIRAVCADLGRTMADVALAWCAQRAGITCVAAGAASPGQVQQNLTSLDRPLPVDVMERLDEVTQPLTDALGPNPDMWQSAANSRFR
jgi:aryl-alcohol dehydrogenase-like predicted oxidoreductase